MKKFLLSTIGLLAFCVAVSAQVAVSGYVPLAPCRLFDSRSGAILVADSTSYDLWRGDCNIPAEASAVAVSVTALDAPYAGELVVWDSGVLEPSAATMTYRGGGPDSSFAIVRLCYPILECSEVDVAIKVRSAQSHIYIDAVGYWTPIQ